MRNSRKIWLTVSAINFFLWVFAQPAPASDASAAGLSVKIVISDQKLFLTEGRRNIRAYDISSSKFGIGNRQQSNQTPLGKHCVAQKIGLAAVPNTIFRNRVNTRQTAKINQSVEPLNDDLITSRILWLTGMEEGFNKGGRVDSFRRFIYIHGTADEGLIGKPASHGCIRMRNKDVIDLFDRVAIGTPVEIAP